MFHNAKGLTVAPSLVCSLSSYCDALQFVCLLKWIYELCYLVLTILTLTKWTSDLKKVPAKRPRIENTASNASTNKQQQNGRSDTSPTPSMSSLPLFLPRNMANNLIRSDKKSAKKSQNFQEHYLKYKFTSATVNDEPCPKCILCLEILAKDSMKPL